MIHSLVVIINSDIFILCATNTNTSITTSSSTITTTSTITYSTTTTTTIENITATKPGVMKMYLL